MTSTPTWSPILDGARAEQAWAVVTRITSTLVDWQEPYDATPVELPRTIDEPSRNPSIARGAAGLALFHGYAAKIQPASQRRDAIDRYVEQAMASDYPSSLGLYGGLTGLAWVLEHLGPELTGFDDPGEEVDIALAEVLDRPPGDLDFDLISGLAGMGVYALSRVHRGPASVRLVETLVRHFAELVEQRPEGLGWRAAPQFVPPLKPRDQWDLGVAHGIPGVIAFLASACAANISVATARPLLDRAVATMFANYLPGGFPAFTGGQWGPARVAWCYGDAGVTVSLFLAGRCVGEPTWCERALEIARAAAARTDPGVLDAGLCHGSSGVAHCFNRLFQATGDELFRDAAMFWIDQTFRYGSRDDGVAGYCSWIVTQYHPKLCWARDPGVLTGTAGIALVLLAALTSDEPAWDSSLMLSPPHAARMPAIRT